MKKLSNTTLHKNFILIHDFFYENEPMKAWVRKDITYNGNYHDDIGFLFDVIRKIGEDTGYELIMYFESSSWNKFGNNPLGEKQLSGYGKTIHLYEAVVEFLKWYTNKSKFAHTCSECGKGMNEGFCINSGQAYYCRKKCLHKHYTKKQWEEMYEDGGDSYWTTWDPETDTE